MGLLLYMRSVLDRHVVMRPISVLGCNESVQVLPLVKSVSRNEKQKGHVNSAPVHRRPAVCMNCSTTCGSSVLAYLPNSNSCMLDRMGCLSGSRPLVPCSSQTVHCNLFTWTHIELHDF